MFTKIRKTKATKQFPLPRFEVTEALPDDDVEALQAIIDQCVANKEFVTYGDAAKLLGFGKFYPSLTGQVIAWFEQANPGSSAIIVNRQGRYGEGAPEEHEEFLRVHGYEVMPKIRRFLR